MVDEPEVYLHPDVQRQLLGILREAGPEIILATHSAEIMGEADPTDILLIDKSKKSADRLRHTDGLQNALDALGSIHNLTLVQLARNRRVLYVEDLEDYKILRRFAGRLGISEIATGGTVTPLRSGGFGSWKEILATAKRIQEATGINFRIATVYDRDYYCTEQIDTMTKELSKHLDHAHILERKEIENYLLLPTVLDRLLYHLISERAKTQAADIPNAPSTIALLKTITDGMHDRVQAQYIARRNEFFRGQNIDQAITMAETIKWFNEKWNNLSTRLELVPGKETLSQLRDCISQNYNVSFTNMHIVDACRKDEVPLELQLLIKRLQTFAIDAVKQDCAIPIYDSDRV